MSEEEIGGIWLLLLFPFSSENPKGSFLMVLPDLLCGYLVGFMEENAARQCTDLCL